MVQKPENYCYKEKEIAILETKQEGMAVILKDLQSDMKLVLRKLDTVEVIAQTHEHLLSRVEQLEEERNIESINGKSRRRRSDFANFPIWKKITVTSGAVTGIGIILTASYYIITYGNMLIEFLIKLPK